MSNSKPKFQQVGPVGNTAVIYGDFICDWCGKPEDRDHPPRPGGPWLVWCPNPRDPETPRFYLADRTDPRRPHQMHEKPDKSINNKPGAR